MTDHEDRADITEVLLRYATGIDRRDWELFATAFTEDCDLDYGEIGSWHGVDAVVEIMTQMHAMVGPTMHQLSNLAITVDGDGAESRTYIDGIILGPDSQGGVNALGFYDDELVRTDTGWRIARRKFTQVRLTPIGQT